MQSKLKKESKIMNLCMTVIPPVILLLLLFGVWEAYCQINDVPVWKLPKPKAKVTRIVQRSTTSKMQAEPMCCIRKWDLTHPKHWPPLAMLPMRS